MNVRNLRRVGVVAWPVAIGAVLLAACGAGDDASPSRSTIELNDGSTAFVVREPVTTVADESAVAEDGTTAASQEYTVQSGDYPLGVAEQFGVSLDDLVNFNDWASANEFPFPGAVIRIPPGATAAEVVAEDEAAADADATDADATDEAEETGDTIPEAGDNCDPGSYTITEDDTTRIGVAEKFDVTVAALDAANAGTSGYNAFFPGLEIVIPAKADC